MDFYNLIDYARDDVLVESEPLLARKRLPRKLQKNSLVLGLHFSPPLKQP